MIYYKLRLRLAATIALGAHAAVSLAQGAPADLQLLQEQMRGLQSLIGQRVQVTGKFEGYNAVNGVLPKAPTGYYNFKTESIVGDDTWLRMDCAPYQAGVTDQPGNYSTRNVEFLLDSGKWYTFTKAFAHDDRTFKVKRCLIEKEIPIWIGGDRNESIGTGLAAVLPMLKIYGSRTLLSLLQDPKLPYQYATTLEDKAGEKVFTFKDSCSATELHFAPVAGEGYTLRRMVMMKNLCVPGAERLEISYQFSDQKATGEKLNTIPFFSKIERTFSVNGVVHEFNRLAIESVDFGSAGGPKEIVLEPGWQVDDQILGVVYITADTAETTLKSLRKILNR
jgi:hypothetical protein